MRVPKAIRHLATAVILMAVASRGGDQSAAPKHTDKGHVGKPQTTCPVMGGKINKKLYVDVDGKRIYVCCAGCIAPIKKDPAKYVKKLKAQGVAVEAVPSDDAHKGGHKGKKTGHGAHDHKGHGHH